MAKYPTREVSNPQPADPKTGGSITFVNHEPDFENFTNEHWQEYRFQETYKEKERYKGVIGWLVLIILGILGYYGL